MLIELNCFFSVNSNKVSEKIRNRVISHDCILIESDESYTKVSGKRFSLKNGWKHIHC